MVSQLRIDVDLAWAITKWRISLPLHLNRLVPSGMTPFPCVVLTVKMDQLCSHSKEVAHLDRKDWSSRSYRIYILCTLPQISTNLE
jgi:hypothetical protein